MTSFRYFLGMSTALGTVTLACSSAGAQTSATDVATHPPVGQDAGTASTSGDIVVTAQRREQRVIDVPFSIGVLSGDQISKNGTTQVRDLDQAVANLTISKGADFQSKVTIRGVGSNSRNIGFDSRVGVYIDGVYIGQSPALNTALLDVSRIEVLRGPQDTLFGKNNIAGAINIVTETPKRDFEGYAEGMVGNLGERSISGVVNAPIASTVTLRIGGALEHEGGYVNNLFNGSKLGGYSSQATFGKVQWEVAPQLTATFAADYYHVRRDTIVGVPLTNSFGTAVNAISSSSDLYTTTDNIQPQERRTVWGTSTRLEYAASDNIKLTSITSYRYTTAHYLNDADYSSADILSVNYNDRYKQLTEEVQASANLTGRGNAIVGLFYYDQVARTLRNVVAGADALATLRIPNGGTDSTNGTVNTRNYAAYGNLSYKILPALELAGGLRYSHERKQADWTSGGGYLGIFVGSVHSPHTDDYTSVSASAKYAIAPALNLYGRFATGYKSGGFNLDIISTLVASQGLEFQRETVRAYEIGSKGELFDRHLTYTLAAFLNDYSNYQASQFITVGTSTVNVIRNAASARTKGIEAEVNLTPLQGLSLRASGGYLDAKFTSFPGGGMGNTDASGKRLPYAAKFTGFLSADYKLVVTRDTKLGLYGDIYYNDGYYTTFDNLQTRRLASGAVIQHDYVPSYVLVGLRTTLSFSNDRYEASLWVKNVFDKRYLVDSIQDALNTLVNTPSRPRTFGGTLRAKF